MNDERRTISTYTLGQALATGALKSADGWVWCERDKKYGPRARRWPCEVLDGFAATKPCPGPHYALYRTGHTIDGAADQPLHNGEDDV